MVLNVLVTVVFVNADEKSLWMKTGSSEFWSSHVPKAVVKGIRIHITIVDREVVLS